MTNISRREFIKTVFAFAAAFYSRKLFAAQKYLLPVSTSAKTAVSKTYKLAIIKGADPAKTVRRAVDAVGGIKKFVRPGNIVVVKPNMSWDRTPEQAANTNPAVVSEIVKMCLEAGAKKVKVFDRPCSNALRAYKNSGVEEAARKAGADVFHVEDWNYIKAKFKYKSPLEDWPVYRDAVEADCFINVPVLKHHGLTGLTLSMKNLMGVMGGNRGSVHGNIGIKLAHITDYISPELTIMDATRFLSANGPSGGSLSDVRIYNTIIAGTDPVLVDSHSAMLVGYKSPLEIGYIREAADMGLGFVSIDAQYILRETV